MAIGGANQWRYEADEHPKRKHHWRRNVAGFVTQGGVIVGKCPSGMTTEFAEAMLNDGVPWSPLRWRHDYPKRIYNILDGVVYRAVPTNPGVSYHGFPERLEHLPTELIGPLLALAEALGERERIERWLKGK